MLRQGTSRGANDSVSENYGGSTRSEPAQVGMAQPDDADQLKVNVTARDPTPISTLSMSHRSQPSHPLTPTWPGILDALVRFAVRYADVYELNHRPPISC